MTHKRGQPASPAPAPKPQADKQVELLTAQVLAAAKYAALDPVLVRGVIAAELAKGRKSKAAVKAAKTKLHQIRGAYQAGELDYAAWLQAYAGAAHDPAAACQLCIDAMQAHASTRERLPILNEFYRTLFVDLPPAPQVVDLACGLNPLALAWMPLPAGYRYWACDIDRAQTAFLNAYFGHCRAPAAAHMLDVVHGNVAAIPAADVVLLLKTIPCLEQVDSHIGPRLLHALRCKTAFVSFPTRSLGGRQRGMATHYSDHFAQIAPPGYAVRRYDFPNELVFRLDRR